MSLINLLKKKCTRQLFTTPSHSGRFFIVSKFRQFYKYDISETDEYNPQEALDKAEKFASKVYGTKQTIFLTNGSTSGIITAVLACCKKDDGVLLWENAHPCHHNAVYLAGVKPYYYTLKTIENWGIPDKFDSETLDKYLTKDNIKAVIVTSPTYEGVTSDIKELKKVCQKHGAYLIVDEAHGALYPFSEKLPDSAVKIADFTVQSLHKTAGGLNPTALLHTNTDFDIKETLSKINTTSPSYPLLASIEANIRFLNSSRGRKILNKLLDELKEIQKNCTNYEIYAPDITKINLKRNGLTGFELSEILYDKFKIEDEKTNEISTLLLSGIGTDNLKLERLKKLFKKRL
ncbi:aminotransferase class I/II-fold pyridoxal phosphate-dependent enzyme [bacterium]|nr:aminotransferase class I/II-fold pyridoxal phosphate-dependent enzyme [bacterium]